MGTNGCESRIAAPWILLCRQGMIAAFPVVVGRACGSECLHEPVPGGIEVIGFHKGPESQDRLAALKPHLIPDLFSRSPRRRHRAQSRRSPFPGHLDGTVRLPTAYDHLHRNLGRCGQMRNPLGKLVGNLRIVGHRECCIFWFIYLRDLPHSAVGGIPGQPETRSDDKNPPKQGRFVTHTLKTP